MQLRCFGSRCLTTTAPSQTISPSHNDAKTAALHSTNFCHKPNLLLSRHWLFEVRGSAGFPVPHKALEICCHSSLGQDLGKTTPGKVSLAIYFVVVASLSPFAV